MMYNLRSITRKHKLETLRSNYSITMEPAFPIPRNRREFTALLHNVDRDLLFARLMWNAALFIIWVQVVPQLVYTLYRFEPIKPVEARWTRHGFSHPDAWQSAPDPKLYHGQLRPERRPDWHWVFDKYWPRDNQSHFLYYDTTNCGGLIYYQPKPWNTTDEPPPGRPRAQKPWDPPLYAVEEDDRFKFLVNFGISRVPRPLLEC